MPSVGIIDYAKETKVDDKIEVVGLCCTAHDMTRYYNRARIVGPISWELRFIRAGLADVVVLDEQCIRTDVYDEAGKVNAPVIAASEKNCMGFKNRTNDPADEIVADLVSGKVKGVLILDPEKVGEVAVRVAQQVAPIRKRKNVLPSIEELTTNRKDLHTMQELSTQLPTRLRNSSSHQSSSRRRHITTN